MTLKQMMAEVANALKSYDESGLLDEIAIKNWIIECVKEFGGNIMVDSERVLEVKNSRAELPDNYWSMQLALKCEPYGYIENKKKEPSPQSFVTYVERTEIGDYYNHLSNQPCEEDGDCKYITETLFFAPTNKWYTTYYSSPQLLELERHSYRIKCDKSCPNVGYRAKYKISVDPSEKYIQTNFSKGNIFLHYRGLPTDEYGELFIPVTSRDKLKNYILYNVIRRTLEMLWLSEDDKNVWNKIQYFKQLEDQHYLDAKIESISKGMLGWKKKYIQKKRLQNLKYESMYRHL